MTELIAAGEVVERPASVVKELVENSLDAGSTEISIELIAGGRQLIRVTDNGHGMNAAELRLAVQRHATSKIAAAGDLLRVQSLGFRGEALPSIAAVAKVAVLTRPADAVFGHRLEVHGSRIAADETAAGPPGTEVTVADLFFNAPARRKHLRRDPTEAARALAVAEALAVARPDVGFRFSHNGKVLLQTAGDGNLVELFTGLLNVRAQGGAVVQVAWENERELPGVRIEALIGLPALALAGRSRQFFVVNGRPVRSDELRRALERPFRRLLLVHRYPVAVVKVHLPADAVDVNVHPSKQQVRIINERVVGEAVTKMVHEALAKVDLAPRVQLEPQPPSPVVRSSDPPGSPTQALAESAGTYAPAPNSRRFAELQVLGHIDRTYLVAKGPEGLYLLDQHAAHERVVFEHLLRGVAGARLPVQQLAVPVVVELAPETLAYWQEWGSAVERFGFTAESFGERSVIIRTVPLLYRREADAQVFVDLLNALGTTGNDAAALELDLAQRTTAACKAAVKANDRLDFAEAAQLLAELDGCANPHTCPHGRPTLLVITKTELERHFRRVV